MKPAIAPTLLLALIVTSCGTETGEQDGPETTSQESASQLTVKIDSGEGAAQQTWELTCDPPGGNHPDPAAACAAISGAEDPFAPVPKDMMCTQQYGGPETATITGSWNGTPVNASYSQINGCEIARWNALSQVFGAHSGGSGDTDTPQ